MSTKTDFTPEEWETIRNAPYLAAAAVMVAGRSGILGSIKEAFATAQTFDSASSESPLIKALSAQDEVKLSQEFVSNQVSFREASQAPEKLRSLAVETCQAAVGLLNQKGGAGEAESYKRWVMDGREGRQCCERRRFLAWVVSGSVTPKKWSSLIWRRHAAHHCHRLCPASRRLKGAQRGTLSAPDGRGRPRCVRQIGHERFLVAVGEFLAHRHKYRQRVTAAPVRQRGELVYNGVKLGTHFRGAVLRSRASR